MGGRVTTQGSSSSRLPRIGIDALTLSPMMSGVGQAIHNLLQCLPQAAPEFDYLVYHSRMPRHSQSITLPHMRMKRAWLPTQFRPMRILWQQAVLPVRACMDKVDLIHAPAYTAPIMTRKPVVLTIYDTIAIKLPELSKRLNVLHYRVFMRASAKRAARIIVPSEATRRDVVAVLGVASEKIRVVPLAVSEAFRPVDDAQELRRARKELGLPERYILFTGNIEPKKNLPASAGHRGSQGVATFAGLQDPACASHSGDRTFHRPRAAEDAARTLFGRKRLRLPVPLRGVRPAATRGHGVRNACCHYHGWGVAGGRRQCRADREAGRRA